MPRRRVAHLALALLVGASALRSASLRAQELPARLGDRAYWQLIEDLSEPGGYFRSDNFLSNETAYQYVIPELQRRFVPGGVYLGVGPEQNFTYLAALRPKIAFIFDIRRQNLIEQLLYKALIESSADRAEFLSRLFSRARPAGLDTSATPEVLFTAYAGAVPDSAMYRRNLRAVTERLTKTHGFALSEEDLASLAYVYGAFFEAGPDLSYTFGSGRGRFGRGWMPTYAQLMTETDGEGTQRSYLATEENYRVLRRLELDNLVVPLVGDFAGSKAIAGVAKYLASHHAVASAFYTSNVEQYLFRQADDWKHFYDNVAMLPVDSTSVFIRAVFNGMAGFLRPPPPQAPPTYYAARSVTLLSPIAEVVKAYQEGRITTYFDVVQLSK